MELKSRIENALVATSFARDWRNRRIAHTDETVRIRNVKLAAASRKKLSDAIDSIAACVRRFALVELDVTLMTHPIRPFGNDELHFLEMLYLGKLEMERVTKAKKDFMEKRDWQGFSGLEDRPSWLTFRPESKHDAE